MNAQCPICNHKDHRPGRCENCNCGQSEIAMTHDTAQPYELKIDHDYRGPAVNKGHRVKRKKTDND